ncbi:MAG: aminoacyl-histidine dipeptidase [Gemmatimonadota bacterium]
MSFISEWEPHALWAHFDEILKIPRASKDEGQIRQYVLGVAERNGLEAKVDGSGNVVVRKPGSPGHENAAATILQSHLDMVQEKNSDVEHDFETDAIAPVKDGAYLKADGTTLGSDNGIGVAAMLALMEDQEAEHGPLEFLFTVDEETGLTGAAGLGDDMLAGRQLLNLDSEEEGIITIGCAGGGDTHLQLPMAEERAEGSAVHIVIQGLKGGHSGVDIHLQRANAIKVLSRALYAAWLEEPFRVADLSGGNAHNAIPREASATVVLKGEKEVARFRGRLEEELDTIVHESSTVDPGMTFEVTEVSTPPTVWDEVTTRRGLALLTTLPHGVVRMSPDIPGLVETSTNLAVAARRNGDLDILLSSRSSVASALRALRQRIRSAGSLAGAEAEEEDAYPGWEPDVGSRLLGVVKEVYAEHLGEPEVGAIHAGLECGIIGEKYDGMDMVSFGPQIEFPHSPDERVKIDSVQSFYVVLRALLERLS